MSDSTQINKGTSLPLAVINYTNQSFEKGVSEVLSTGQKYKVSLSIEIELVHNSQTPLFDLIESVETALKIGEKLNGTLSLNYHGWNKAERELGSGLIGAIIELEVTYIKTA